MRSLKYLVLAVAAGSASPAFAQDGFALSGTENLAIADDAVASCQGAGTGDPLEGFNRGMYAANDTADRVILEPVARGYRAVTPRFFRRGVSNFLRNLNGPIVFVNNLLQGEFRRAGVTFARFGINTTIGIAGVIDVADDMGFEHRSEDFGQTLAVWGVPSGAYIFLPILGPTNVRDGVGRIVDTAINPLNWAEFDNDDIFRTTIFVASAISAREENIEAIDDLRATSIDPYVSVRNTYNLMRESAIRNGLQDVQDLPEFESTPETSADPAEAPAPVEEDAGGTGS